MAFGSSSINSTASLLQAQTTPQNSSSGNAAAGSQSPLDAENIGKDGFLQLLLTQLQNQDPTSPMDNMEFSAQLAQFASVEQLQNLNSNFEATQKTQQVSQLQGLVGKEVSYASVENGEEARANGVVDAVRILEDGTYALINGQEVDVSNIDTIIRAGFQMTEEAEPEGAARQDGEEETTSSSASKGSGGLLSKLFR